MPGLNGGWHIVVGRDARLKGLPQELCRLLQVLERGERTRPGPEVRDGLTQLGVVYARQGDTDYRGSVYVTLEIPPDRSSGVVASTGDALSEWVSEWMRDPSRSDKLAKLGRSGAPERHLFVIVPGVVTTAPFPVTNLLMRPDAPLPTVSPSLPPEVTHVWIMSTWAAGHGFRWSPERGWQTFATHVVPDPSPVGGCTCR